MSKKISTIQELHDIAQRRWSELDSISPKYLSEAGEGAKEALQNILWHLAFHDSVESLRSDEQFMNLINMRGKHPEYYYIIKSIYRAIEDTVL